MKKYTIYFGVLILAVAIVVGCKKHNYDDLLPKVEVSNVRMITADTGVVTAQIVQVGGFDIDAAGFAYDTVPDVSFTDNQIKVDPSNESFQAKVPMVPGRTYYFRAIVNNYAGYNFSDVFAYKVPQPTPIEPPCSLSAETIVVHDTYKYHVTSTYSGTGYAYIGQYGMEVSCNGGPTIDVDFRRQPDPGIYITRSFDGFRNGTYRNDIYLRMEDEPADAGDTLYVTKDQSGHLEFQTCHMRCNFAGQMSNLQGRWKDQ